MNWLSPVSDTFASDLAAIDSGALSGPAALEKLQALSRSRLDLVQTSRLDRRLQAVTSKIAPTAVPFARLRVALLSSSTIDHVAPFLRIAALRRCLLIEIYTGPFNQYRQEILNPASALYSFKPNVVVLALDAQVFTKTVSLSTGAEETAAQARKQVAELENLWRHLAQPGISVVQQNFVLPPRRMFGHLDASIPGTEVAWFSALNNQLATSAQKQGVLLFDTEALASQVGKSLWNDAPLWHHAKQAFSPQAAPLYADHVARLLAATRGLSKKCLVLDLDNTLWGGVIGDDGLEGIELGQGTAVGEAFREFQKYVKGLKERGILLAVCSKNDEATAKNAFDKHPEMTLKLSDIVAFVANWEDKASNIRKIAQNLQIGLDSIVFFDDNPVERSFVRQHLPAVEVPEVPSDPSLFVGLLSDAGYFESIAFTADDQKRTASYAVVQELQTATHNGQDIDSFLRGLQMKMNASPFDAVSAVRIAQLINKSNQFNLTTRRYTEAEVHLLEKDTKALTFQFRLQDHYGDSGIISLVILHPESDGSKTARVDTWLMSCRVLGRKVENEVLNIVAREAKRAGYNQLLGSFIPTAKNALVKDHYKNLGFAPASFKESGLAEGSTQWKLDLASFKPHPTPIESTYTERTTS